MLRKIVAFGTLALLSATASAAEGDSAFRLGIGASRLTIDMDDVDLKGHATGWEVFGGYEFNRYIAIEFGYLDGGTAKDKIIDGVTAQADTYGYAASIVASLPLSDAVHLYGRAGYLHWESEQTIKVGGETFIAEDFDGNDPFFGAGVALEIEGALLRLEYRIASLDDSDISLLGASLAWRF
jgi:OOP family OmpA-OmpF porin